MACYFFFPVKVKTAGIMIAPLLLLASAALAGPIGYKREYEEVKVGYGAVDLVRGPDFYAVPVAIGDTNSNQTVLLKLDTNSPARWVNEVDNDFCLAYYPFPGIENTNASEWNAFNSELRNEYLNQLAEIEQIQNSFFQSELKPTASYSAQESALSERAKSFQATISQIKASLTSEVAEFGKSYATANSKDFSSLSSAIYANIQEQKSRFGGLTTAVPAVTQSVHAYVSSIDTAVVTVISATQTVSGSQVNNSQAAGAWDQFTSQAANWFSKRDFETSTLALSEYTTFASPTTTHSFDPSAIAIQSVLPSGKQDFYDAQVYEQIADCSIYGTFNTSKSNSFVSNETIYISDNEYEVYGVVGNDTLTIGNLALSNTSFAVAEFSESNIGALGVGQSVENVSSFDSLPDLLASEGLIGKSLYSLKLTEYNPQLLFGAIDYNYLYDNITLVPLLNDTESIAITLSSLGFSYESYDENYTIVDLNIAEGQAFATLDTTTKGIYLPEDVLYTLVSTINQSFPIEYDELLGRYVLTIDDFSYSDENATDLYTIEVAFNFQGLDFEIPLINFLTPIETNETAYFNQTVSSGNAKNDSFYFTLNGDDGLDYYYITDDSIETWSEIPNDDASDDSDDYDDSNDGSDDYDDGSDDYTDYDNSDDSDDGSDDYTDYDNSDDSDFNSTTTQLILSFLPSDGDDVRLGLDFLENVYVVVDLEAKVVGLAPLIDWDFDTDEYDELAIVAITDEIPFAVNATFFDDYYGSSNVTSLLV